MKNFIVAVHNGLSKICVHALKAKNKLSALKASLLENSFVLQSKIDFIRKAEQMNEAQLVAALQSKGYTIKVEEVKVFKQAKQLATLTATDELKTTFSVALATKKVKNLPSPSLDLSSSISDKELEGLDIKSYLDLFSASRIYIPSLLFVMSEHLNVKPELLHESLLTYFKQQGMNLSHTSASFLRNQGVWIDYFLKGSKPNTFSFMVHTK